jgi:hypothetical protein
MSLSDDRDRDSLGVGRFWYIYAVAQAKFLFINGLFLVARGQ